ncbi:hypothetical protein IWW51_001256 [Coemansia sp. RSA 2702]|nr:hypothetical protein IWW51_001256 [Coemansia sp. RSA 2702]
MFVLAGQAILSDGSSVAAGSGALAPADALEPGASLLVPVWIRGDRVGAHALSLIVGASTTQPASALASKAGSKLRSRRFDIDLVVTPSLRVNAFVRPSLRDPHERIVGIEVENVQTDLDVRLVQTTFTSGYFELVPLSAVCDPADGGAAREVNVGPRQTVNLMYRARPHRAAAVNPVRAEPELFTIGALQQYIFSKDKPTALPEPIRLVYSSTVLGERGIDCVHSALQGYISRAQAHRRRNMLRSAYPLLPEKLQPVLFPLYETFGIDFVLFWSENGGRRTGHHSITGIDLGVPHDYIVEALNPPRAGVARTWLKDTLQEREALIQSIASRAAATRRAERPLDVVIKLAGVGRQGTAGSDGMTAADVDVTVYNHSWRHGYDVALQLVSPSEIERLAAAGVKLEHPGPRSAWSWVGTTKHSLSVPPLGSVSVRAQVACSASGIIDVALWELSATAVDPQLALDTPAAHAADGQHWSTSRECRLRPLHPSFINVAAE